MDLAFVPKTKLMIIFIAMMDIGLKEHTICCGIVLANNMTWDRSAERASIMRKLLEQSGVATTRIKRVTGHADRQPVTERNPMAIRNNRLEVILLR